jgi:hypothetical protein
VRYFLLEIRTLLTVVDDPSEEYLRIICRDATGKYCWKVKCTNDDPADDKSMYVKGADLSQQKGQDGDGLAPLPSVSGVPLPPPPPPPPTEDPLLSILPNPAEDLVENATKHDDEDFKAFMTRVAGLEMAHVVEPGGEGTKTRRRKSTRHHMARRHTENHEGELVESVRDRFSWRNSRRLLSQIGFMNVEAWGRLEILDGTKQLESKIVAMDDTPEKDQHIVWIVRARAPASEASAEKVLLRGEANEASVEKMALRGERREHKEGAAASAEASEASTKRALQFVLTGRGLSPPYDSPSCDLLPRNERCGARERSEHKEGAAVRANRAGTVPSLRQSIV